MGRLRFVATHPCRDKAARWTEHGGRCNLNASYFRFCDQPLGTVVILSDHAGLACAMMSSQEDSEGRSVMKSKASGLGNWELEIHEESAGVYIVKAVHAAGATFQLKGTDGDGGESFLQAYAIVLNKSIGMNVLHDLANWSVNIREIPGSKYLVDAAHNSGPRVSFTASSADDAAVQLHAYAGELEEAIERKRQV